MKKVYNLCLWAVLLLMAFLLIMNGVRRNDEALASRIAPEVLRFHVLANSDSSEDQALKLAVKDFLLELIRTSADSLSENSPEHTSAGDVSSIMNKDMMKQFILDNKSELELQTEKFIKTCGFEHPVEIRLETCHFPVKTYGDMTFPAGTYDAVRVLIGDGAGENFWCVLYPSLCYLDSAYAVVPDSSKKVLQAVLPEDDFQALLAARHIFGRTAVSSNAENIKTEPDVLLPRITFRLKLLELLSR